MIRPVCAGVLVSAFPDLVVMELELLDSSVQGAVFSPCPDGTVASSLYRYLLWRIWRPGGRYLVALMLNPSTATHLDDDNTVDRMTTRAFRMGYDGLIVVNAFAWRDTLPRDMRQALDPIGPANDAAIDAAVDEAAMVICGWGANGDHLGRAPVLARRLEERGVALNCLGRVSSGHPEHPLYLSFARKPEPWSTSSLVK